MQYLKQSTAVTLKFGPFVDETDGKTAETALTLSQADFRLSKNGGDFAQKNEATSGTHDEIGYYDVPLNTTDTNTLGSLLVAVHESGALPVWREYTVLAANVYDSLIGGGDLLDTNISGAITLHTSQPAVTFASITCTGTFTISDGLVVTRSTADSTAILVTGSGTGHGICAKSGTGATGVGILAQAQSTDGHGIAGYGSGSWNGIYGWGGAGTGIGIKAQGGDTSGYGLECTAVSGAAMHALSLSGYGFQIIATGTNNAAIKLTPGSGGYGIDGTLATVATATALTTNNDKTGYALTSGERTSIANEVEAQIIDDTDSEKVLEAITNKIASVNPSLDDLTLGGIASAVRTELTTELARIDAAISTRLASASITLSSGKVTVGTNDDKTGYSLSTTPPTAAAIVTAIRAMEIESGETFDQLIQRMRSVLYGKVTGAATVTNIFYRADGSTVAVRMTVDSDGNRSAVTFT